MFKLTTTLAITFALAGCAAWTPVKYTANQVCGASSERKEELADSLDKATFPHEVRINCHVQEH